MGLSAKSIPNWVVALVLIGFLVGMVVIVIVVMERETGKGWQPTPLTPEESRELAEQRKESERRRKEIEERVAQDRKSGKVKVEELDEVKREHEVSKRKMELLREMGLVMDLGSRSVYVEPAVWYGMTLPEKHSVAKFFSKFFVEKRLMEKGIKKMPESLRTLFLYEKFKITASVYISDGYSGVRLGKANSYGFFLD